MNKEQEKVLEKINEKLLSNKKNSIDMARAEIENILDKDQKLKDELFVKLNDNEGRENNE